MINFPNVDSPPSLPKDVKEAVSKCRGAVQQGLQNRLSRMDIEFPVGTKFGVEKNTSGKKARGEKLSAALDDDGNNMPTKEMFDKSDRELARLFVEMFQPVGGNVISVVFTDGDLADAAGKMWKGEVGADCKIMSMNRGKEKNKQKSKKKKSVGFAAKMNQELDDNSLSSGPFQLPSDCEVALFVSPGPKELITVRKICDDVGMSTLVVLLNARLNTISNFGSDEAQDFFQDEFEPIFHLTSAPQDVAPGCLTHRCYPNDDWIIALKKKVGPPKTIAAFDHKPTDEECQKAYNELEVGDLEKGVDNVLENVASWFN